MDQPVNQMIINIKPWCILLILISLQKLNPSVTRQWAICYNEAHSTSSSALSQTCMDPDNFYRGWGLRMHGSMDTFYRGLWDNFDL